MNGILRKVSPWFRQLRLMAPNRMKTGGAMVVSDEVQSAITEGRPVVALESTIVTHGMPYPHNLSMARSVESIIRQEGAVPATIALIDGNACVGINDEQLTRLAELKEPAVKVSRRDIGTAISRRILGGTTISGTMLLAHMSGIQIFVSGGLGGVHRGGESSMDVSADLTELGRTPVAVITSGVKSILDIGRTLEYLETQGVCVATYGPTNEFPAFFTAKSGFTSPYNVKTVDDAASMIHSTFSMGINSGVLLAVPVPKQFQMEGEKIEESIQTAVEEANEKGIKGKDITPYVLARVNALTEGKSLEANIALVLNNARIGAQIACNLAHLKMTDSRVLRTITAASGSPSAPVIIGASILDTLTKILDDDIRLDGATYRSQVTNSFGGVGRNLADAMSRLGTAPKLLSALGNDQDGDFIIQENQHMDWSRVQRCQSRSTATYNVVLDGNGEAILGIAGDMSIHEHITPQYIEENADVITGAPLVCMDGNLPLETIKIIGEICITHDIPVFYEPTDKHKACKPLQADVAECIHFIKPNLHELQVLLNYLYGDIGSGSNSVGEMNLNEIAEACQQIVENVIPNVIVSMGKNGILLCTRKDRNRLKIPAKSGSKMLQDWPQSLVFHYPALPVDQVTSSSGAGDCFGAAFINGYLLGHTGDLCIKAGLKAAWMSLQSTSTVPGALTPNIYEDLWQGR